MEYAQQVQETLGCFPLAGCFSRTRLAALQVLRHFILRELALTKTTDPPGDFFLDSLPCHNALILHR